MCKIGFFSIIVLSRFWLLISIFFFRNFCHTCSVSSCNLVENFNLQKSQTYTKIWIWLLYLTYISTQPKNFRKIVLICMSFTYIKTNGWWLSKYIRIIVQRSCKYVEKILLTTSLLHPHKTKRINNRDWNYLRLYVQSQNLYYKICSSFCYESFMLFQ